MRRALVVMLVSMSAPALAQVPAGAGGTAADADKGDFAPPSTGCGNVECEIAAVCATADPGIAARMCEDTVRKSHAIRLAAYEKRRAAIRDAPLNPHRPGRSIHLQAKQPAPWTGQLVEDTEHSRREFNNELTAGELAALKRDRGSKIVSVPALVAIILGSVAVGVGGTVAVYELTR